MCATNNLSSFDIRALSFSLLVEKREHQFAFGDDRVVYYAMAFGLGKSFAARIGQLGMNEDGVARENRFTKFHSICAHEIADATGIFCQFESQDAGHLCHRFDLHYTRHHRVTGKMSLKERLVNRDRFDPDTFGFALETDDPVDHQKRETMRQNLHYLVGVEPPVTPRNRACHGKGAPACLLAGERASQVGIDSVTGFYRYHVAPNAPPDPCKISNDLENFVAHEFVCETQWFLAQNRLAADNNRVFEAAAFDQIFLHERLNILVENKGPRRGDLALENCRRDFRRQILREPIIWPGLRA